ncbi:SP_0009 family protein [Streptococcus sp. zg-JUN1979]
MENIVTTIEQFLRYSDDKLEELQVKNQRLIEAFYGKDVKEEES